MPPSQWLSPSRNARGRNWTQNSLFGIRNLRKPRELSQPNQLDMVGERGFKPSPPSETLGDHDERILYSVHFLREALGQIGCPRKHSAQAALHPQPDPCHSIAR